MKFTKILLVSTVLFSSLALKADANADLQTAILAADLAAVQSAIRAGADLNSSADPLDLAVFRASSRPTNRGEWFGDEDWRILQRNALKVVDHLLNAGAEIKDGPSLLRAAKRSIDTSVHGRELVSRLLRAGAKEA